jgi:hypothetical protein
MQRVVEDGHLDDHPAQALRRRGGDLEGDVGSQRGPAYDRLVEPEVVEKGDHLCAEDRHRVAPHVARLVGIAVPEVVQHVDVIAARSQLLGQRAVHQAGQKQPRKEHDRARAGAVFVIDEAEPLVGEAADAWLSHAARQDNHSTSIADAALSIQLAKRFLEPG